jgi:tetratricopeptide (TPR) repeat protein
LGVVLASKRQYGPAIHEFEIANALQPRTLEILHDLGQAYLRNGQFSKAEATLEQGLELDRNSAETLYLLAQCLADQNKDIEALEFLVRARKFAPENTDAILLMARLSMKQQFYEDAIVLLREGIKLDAARARTFMPLWARVTSLSEKWMQPRKNSNSCCNSIVQLVLILTWVCASAISANWTRPKII